VFFFLLSQLQPGRVYHSSTSVQNFRGRGRGREIFSTKFTNIPKIQECLRYKRCPADILIWKNLKDTKYPIGLLTAQWYMKYLFDGASSRMHDKRFLPEGSFFMLFSTLRNLWPRRLIKLTLSNVSLISNVSPFTSSSSLSFCVYVNSRKTKRN